MDILWFGGGDRMTLHLLQIKFKVEPHDWSLPTAAPRLGEFDGFKLTEAYFL